MAKGYFLRVGDKTTCGGEILTGNPTVLWYGTHTALKGSVVSCGKNPGVSYGIISGTGRIATAGLPMAGTLDSVSSCPCRARFIPSIPDGYNDKPAFIRQRLPVSPVVIPVVVPNLQRTAAPAQRAQAAKKNLREITLTIGIFFDGTGNNAHNATASLDACSGEHFGMNNADSQSAYFQCIQLRKGFEGFAAGSHLGYYTNVHWLNTLYSINLPDSGSQGQAAIYIEGIGTESGEGDSKIGTGTGRGDTGVVSKTDKAVRALTAAIIDYLEKLPDARSCLIKELQFDIFGFSRGAAAARHFANRVFSQDPAIATAINTGLGEVAFSGTPAGITRFLGIFDTVAGIGTPLNGLNPHSADTGEVNIVLRPGIAQKVFHITAQHECRFNFALNSVAPAWPELVLPGAHSDIGGGYHPEEYEAVFLTRPQFVTVPLSTPDNETRIYQQACEQLKVMDRFPAIAPLLQQADNEIIAWHDDRMPADRYGTLQKRSGAALVMKRATRNDWSKVVLWVMLDAAQDAGAVFETIDETIPDFAIPAELNNFCEKAIGSGRAVRNGQSASGFTSAEINVLAGKYLHCSANWNSVIRDGKGRVVGAVKPAKLVTFTNRPDERWQRTIYDMDGKRTWK